MRKGIVVVGFVVVLLVAGYFAYTAFSARSVSGAAVSSVPKKPSTVTAEGIVVPVQHTALAFKTGGRVVEIPVHEGDTVKTGTVLARLDDTLMKGQVAQARAALTIAQRQLDQVRRGGTAAERQAAKEAVAAAQAQYAKVKAGPTADELAVLKANLDGAQAALAQAQFRYDRIGGDANPFGKAAPDALALQQAFINLNAAQAAYRNATSHPTESELKAAEAAIALAEATQARLDPTPEALALAGAQVEQAQAALDLAEAAARDAVLVAPYDGTVTGLGIDVGQVVAPGAPAVTFGDLRQLQVETTDLAEADVTRVTVGQGVTITADALPERVLPGRVARIAQMANDRGGDRVFQVTVALAENSDLRWGMTTNVEFAPGQ